MQYEALNHWTFVSAAYAVGLTGTIGLLVQSWVAMRKAERRRDAARREGDGRQGDQR